LEVLKSDWYNLRDEEAQHRKHLVCVVQLNSHAAVHRVQL